jgi:cytochrome c-type biogenesis protein CcmH/NrfF
MVTGEVTALVGGKVIDHMRPAKWFFHKHESEPTTEVAIRRAPTEDLYITLGNYDLAEGNVTLKIVVNPVVDWIWFGFMLLAVGTAIALIPDTLLDRLTMRAPAREGAGAGASSTGGVAGLIVFLAVGAAAAGLIPGVGERTAQAEGTPAAPAPEMAASVSEPPSPEGVEENWLVRNIMCQCGTCRHSLIDCASEGCGHAAQDRITIHHLLGQGKNREDIIQFFIQKYGSQIALASPIDKGFNRLAWLLPYGLAAVGAAALGYGAYRLARRPGPLAPAGPTFASTDPDLQDKLEDELRNLD